MPKGIDLLYPLVCTAKFSLKFKGVIDFTVSNLECLWFDDPAKVPISKWRWRLQIRIPDALTAQMLRPVRKEVAEKKGLDLSPVKRITWAEGRALQTMHIGPYEKMGESYRRLGQAAEELGLLCKGLGHDIYVSDARRTAPEKLKTIVRMPVKGGR